MTSLGLVCEAVFFADSLFYPNVSGVPKWFNAPPASGADFRLCIDQVQVFCGQKGCEVVELNVQPEHVHLWVMVPPKVSISDLVGILKGRTATRIFKQFPHLEQALLG